MAVKTTASDLSFSLTPDVWTVVCPLLDFDSVVTASQVCRQWRQSLANEAIWKELCLRYFGEHSRLLMKKWRQRCGVSSTLSDSSLMDIDSPFHSTASSSTSSSSSSSSTKSGSKSGSIDSDSTTHLPCNYQSSIDQWLDSDLLDSLNKKHHSSETKKEDKKLGEKQQDSTVVSWKLLIRYFFTRYNGKESLSKVKRITDIWRTLYEWLKDEFPELIMRTLLLPVSHSQMLKVLHELRALNTNVCGIPTDVCVLFGECCGGQRLPECLPTSHYLSRLYALCHSLFGYYQFYDNFANFSLVEFERIPQHLDNFLRTIDYARRRISAQSNGDGNLNDDSRRYLPIIVGHRTQLGRNSWPISIGVDYLSGSLVKYSGDYRRRYSDETLSHAGSLDEYLHWYVQCLCIQKTLKLESVKTKDMGLIRVGVWRFPSDSDASSEKISKGISVKASPIWSVDFSGQEYNVFPYSITIECPSQQFDQDGEEVECARGQLTLRHWRIVEGRSGDGGEPSDVSEVDGPGVIGQYPRVGHGSPLFRYESCTRQAGLTGGRMWGWFDFAADEDGEPDFEIEVGEFHFDQRLCHWV